MNPGGDGVISACEVGFALVVAQSGKRKSPSSNSVRPPRGSSLSLKSVVFPMESPVITVSFVPPVRIFCASAIVIPLSSAYAFTSLDENIPNFQQCLRRRFFQIKIS